MESFEIEKYKVSVKVSDEEVSEFGITIDDILERSPKGWEYLRKLKEYAVSTTKYQWPGCGYSSEMKIIPGGIVITFSETVSDYLKGLKNSQKIADHGSILLRELIKRIEEVSEDEARKIIRDFEQSIREVRG